MKRKKLLSTAVAGMLVAAQMIMPVMAADGGEVDVEVTTKTVVIRVEVPTSLEIAVNQFEKDDAGSQIYSGDFTIQNKSEIPVKMTVTSTITLADTNPIALAATKAGAEDSTAQAGEAWLAVAAATGVDAQQKVQYAASGKTIDDLSETSENVTTFAMITDGADQGKGMAEQTFYLAADTSSNVTYQDVKISDADTLAKAKKVAYAQFYKVTELLTQPDTDDALQTVVNGGDVALIVPGADADTPDSVSVLKKGTKDVTLSTETGAKYYSIADTPTDVSAMKDDAIDSGTYIYGEAGTATTGGDAGFRFIGKLSDKETWTKDDIKKVNIKYDIKGVTGSKYTEVEPKCNYGLYVEETDAAPSIATKTYTMTSGTAVNVTVDLGGGDLAATGIESITYDKGGTATALASSNYTYSNGVLTFPAAYIDKVIPAVTTGRDYVIEFNDTAKTKITITLSK